MNDEQTQSAPGTIVYVLLGPIVWAIHFGAIYFFQSLMCAREIAFDTVGNLDGQLMIVAATVAALAIVAAFVLAPERVAVAVKAASAGSDQRAFQTRLMRLLALLSAVGIAFAGWAAILIPSCPALR
jgi:hypothetical protein